MSPKNLEVAADAAAPETPIYAEATDHLMGICDNCGESGAFAYCVTSKKKHLHACQRYSCKDALEVKVRG